MRVILCILLAEPRHTKTLRARERRTTRGKEEQVVAFDNELVTTIVEPGERLSTERKSFIAGDEEK